MHRLPLHILQLRHPLPDVLALRIELLALQQRIEDAKIRLRVDADAGREAPAAVVAREVAVDQVLHEVALAEAPVEQQVLRQEGRDDHAAPVVHVGGRVHLAHGGVDDGEAGGAGGPAREVVVVVLPLDVGVFVFEGLGHAHVWPMRQNVLVEIPPRHLADPARDARTPAVQLPRAVPIPRQPHARPRRQRARRMVHAHHRRAARGGQIARVLVRGAALGQEPVHARACLVLARRPQPRQARPLLGIEPLALWGLRDRRVEKALELLPRGFRVRGRRRVLVQQLRVRVHVRHPRAEPRAVHGVLPAGAGRERAGGHDDVVVDDGAVDARGEAAARQPRLAPQLVDLVLHVAEEVAGAPLAAPVEQVGGHVLALRDRRDDERDVERGEVVLEDGERAQVEVDARRAGAVGGVVLRRDDEDADERDAVRCGFLPRQAEASVVRDAQVALEPVDDGGAGGDFGAVLGRGGEGLFEDFDGAGELVVVVLGAALVGHFGRVVFALDDAGALFDAGVVELRGGFFLDAIGVVGGLVGGVRCAGGAFDGFA